MFNEKVLTVRDLAEMNEHELDAFRRAINGFQGAPGRWKRLVEAGATDDEIQEQLQYELGLGGASSGPEPMVPEAHIGGSNPTVAIYSRNRFGTAWSGPGLEKAKYLFRGKHLIKAVREFLGISEPGQMRMFQ